MGFHHVALATKDLAATHAFYTEAMGFTLVKTVVGPTESGKGWARHVFYDTGNGELMAFWELHDETIGDSYPTDLNTSIGLPAWVNHLAFDAPDLEVLAAHTRRWQEQGITVVEIGHGFCTSIYATDPNGILVEFCCTTRPFTADEKAAAERLAFEPDPEHEDPPTVKFHQPVVAAPRG